MTYLPSARNKGFGTEAVKAIITWSFTSNQVNKVIAECLLDVISSVRVLEKVGMYKVGQQGNMLKWELTKF